MSLELLLPCFLPRGLSEAWAHQAPGMTQAGLMLGTGCLAVAGLTATRGAHSALTFMSAVIKAETGCHGETSFLYVF